MNRPNCAYVVYTDGGARGNPGPAAYGFVVYDPSGTLVYQAKQSIGLATNNQAEYQGLVSALRYLSTLSYPKDCEIKCCSDSQLMVRQLNGIYRMKNEELRLWYDEARQLKARINAPIIFVDIKREDNRYADALVNQALNEANHV